ncbi:MAG: pyruvate kinase, partial [Candidatus Methylomirabilis sp.]|nr:pyruvate kinase [Deltaproteobacteria bacterium]
MSRLTKIIATIGPASWAPATLRALIDAGMDVARLNFSHGTPESHARVLHSVRAAARRARKPVGVLLDLPGPKFRVGALPEDGVHLEPGARVILDERVRDYRSKDGRIPLRAPGLASGVKPGDRVLLDDGHLALEVVLVRRGAIDARVVRGGRLLSGKGVNLPGEVRIASTLTEEDERGLLFAVEHDADFVALSFVRSARDVQRARDRLKALGRPDIPLIPKLEKPQAIDAFDDILQVEGVAAVMVARGDLGVELPYEQVPVKQKLILERAHAERMPVIIATQMLQSMTEQAQPTRAEVNDVAGAVFGGADAVMLSAETASGNRPVEAVAAMDRILRAAEDAAVGTPSRALTLLSGDPDWAKGNPSRAITETAAVLARRMDAEAIVIFTETGGSARLVSTTHPRRPIYALPTSEAVLRRTTLLYGVRGAVM